MNQKNRNKLYVLEGEKKTARKRIRALGAEGEALKAKGYSAANGAPGEIDFGAYQRLAEHGLEVHKLKDVIDGVENEISVLWRPDRIAWLATSMFLNDGDLTPHAVRDHLHSAFSPAGLPARMRASLQTLKGLEDDVPLFEGLSDAMSFSSVRSEIESFFGRSVDL